MWEVPRPLAAEASQARSPATIERECSFLRLFFCAGKETPKPSLRRLEQPALQLQLLGDLARLGLLPREACENHQSSASFGIGQGDV